MKRFFLSESTNFNFTIFGFQHILMLLITIIFLFLFYIYRDKLKKINISKNKKFRIIMILILLLNMIIYRLIYLFYGIYDIKIHLSLYYCHIVNYLFVLALIINYKEFYKYIYFLSWIGFWAILCPDLSGGIDCYIFYQFFISHNFIIILSTFIVVSYGIKFNFVDCLKGLMCAIIIILLTYVVNYDFKTTFNTPNNILGNRVLNFSIYNKFLNCSVLIIMGFIGSFLGYVINLVYFISHKKCK